MNEIEKARCFKCGYMIAISEGIEKYGPAGPSECPRCGFSDHGRWPNEGVTVRGRVSLKTICDAACVRGTSTDCKCSCGGMNHGAAA